MICVRTHGRVVGYRSVRSEVAHKTQKGLRGGACMVTDAVQPTKRSQRARAVAQFAYRDLRAVGGINFNCCAETHTLQKNLTAKDQHRHLSRQNADYSSDRTDLTSFVSIY